MHNYYKHLWLYPFFLIGSFIRFLIGTTWRRLNSKPTLRMSEYFIGEHSSLKVFRKNDAKIVNTLVGISFFIFTYIVLKGFKII